jgi:hypothetical protein
MPNRPRRKFVVWNRNDRKGLFLFSCDTQETMVYSLEDAVRIIREIQEEPEQAGREQEEVQDADFSIFEVVMIPQIWRKK